LFLLFLIELAVDGLGRRFGGGFDVEDDFEPCSLGGSGGRLSLAPFFLFGQAAKKVLSMIDVDYCCLFLHYQRA
jgi:hypothetical protein